MKNLNKTENMINLADVEKEIKSIATKYGLACSSYELDSIMEKWKNQVIHRVVSGFCDENNLAFDYQALEKFKSDYYNGLKKEKDMLKQLQEKYPNPLESEFKNLIEELMPERVYYWQFKEGEKYKTPEDIEKAMREIHSKRLICRYSLSSPWEMEQAVIKLERYLTGNVIDHFENMPSSYASDYLEKAIIIVNSVLKGLKVVKMYKNGRLDIEFTDKNKYIDFLNKFIAREIQGFITWKENRDNEEKERQAYLKKQAKIEAKLEKDLVNDIPVVQS
jgi:hypothetical protein